MKRKIRKKSETDVKNNFEDLSIMIKLRLKTMKLNGNINKQNSSNMIRTK